MYTTSNKSKSWLVAKNKVLAIQEIVIMPTVIFTSGIEEKYAIKKTKIKTSSKHQYYK